MKLVVKEIGKTLLVFIIATILMYTIFTGISFSNWCKENQVFYSSENLSNLNRDRIQQMGDRVGRYADAIEESINQTNEEGYHSIGEYFDPLGFSVWAYISEIGNIFTRHISTSILSGVAIKIAYVVITNKKMNNILKVVIGYFGVMIIIPPIYSYSYTHRLWDISTMYLHQIPKYFYIGYTLIFLLMYVINYMIGKKMTKDLNDTIKNTKN